VPKTVWAATNWAKVACKNIIALNAARGWRLERVSWPAEAGISAASVGHRDAVVAWKVRWTKDSGEVVLTGEAAAELKQRLCWPEDRKWLADPSRWLATFQEGIPAGRLLSERGRVSLGLANRAWG